MSDAGLRSLQLVEPDEEARRFDAVLEAMAGAPGRASAPQPASPVEAGYGGLVASVKRLEQRVEVLEAELVPLHRGRKCPQCHQLSLVLVTSRPHPEFGSADIEQHDVRCGCGCGYQGSRLYDPCNFLR